MGKKHQARQLSLEFGHRHGGRRRGAGRKPKGAAAGVAHRSREEFVRRRPVFVTQRIAEDCPSLRREEVRALFRALVQRLACAELAVVHWSLQSNHVHLVVEAEDSRVLARKLGGFLGELAKRLNRLWKRKGQVFPDRFDARVLDTPRAVRTALAYTLGNGRKHGAWRGRGPDRFSSGDEFDGWKDWVAQSSEGPKAATWLLKVGWRRHGLVPVLASPLDEQDEWLEGLERRAQARAKRMGPQRAAVGR
jgi:REP element-mobilizing transposase RayT